MFNRIVIILIISGFIYAKDEQKVVLITGTAYGIGKSTAELLIEKGHIVYGGDILVEENLYLNDIGGTALEMDVTNQEHIDKAINQIISEQGRVDVLVNNAGLGVYGAIEDVSMEDIYYQYDVNLFGLARVTKAVLPYMREEESGLIINISSVLGETYGPLAGWYLSTKHALEGWSDASVVTVYTSQGDQTGGCWCRCTRRSQSRQRARAGWESQERRVLQWRRTRSVLFRLGGWAQRRGTAWRSRVSR